MLNWCDPWLNPLLLDTAIDNYVQEEDSKLGQMIYLLWRVILEFKFKKLIPNEQISSRNTRKVLFWLDLEPIGPNEANEGN